MLIELDYPTPKPVELKAADTLTVFKNTLRKVEGSWGAGVDR
jgi:hypothetical protein